MKQTTEHEIVWAIIILALILGAIVITDRLAKTEEQHYLEGCKRFCDQNQEMMGAGLISMQDRVYLDCTCLKNWEAHNDR